MPCRSSPCSSTLNHVLGCFERCRVISVHMLVSLCVNYFWTVFTQQKSTFKSKPLLPLCNRRFFCAWRLVIYALYYFCLPPTYSSYICLKIIFHFGYGLAEDYPAKHELLCARSAIISVISPEPRAFYSCSLFEYVEIVQKRCVPTREFLLAKSLRRGGGGGRGGTAFLHFGHCQIIISYICL